MNVRSSECGVKPSGRGGRSRSARFSFARSMDFARTRLRTLDAFRRPPLSVGNERPTFQPYTTRGAWKHASPDCESEQRVYDRTVTRATTAIVVGLALVSLASCGDQGGGSSTPKEPSVALTKGPPLSASLAIRNCLNAHGYEGRSGPAPPGDTDAPDAAVFFQGKDKGTAGEIGIYATDAEASDKLVGIKADAKSSGVVVAPHGLATVIYYTAPAGTTRADIDGCLSEANAASSTLTGQTSTARCSSTSRTSSARATPNPKPHVPSTVVPPGEPESPLVSVADASRTTGFKVLIPRDLPPEYSLRGVWVPGDGSQARVHFSGPLGEVVLLEAPSARKGRAPNGLEFVTSVNGAPALGVKGDVPPAVPGPVSQVQWWEGGISFDLYGPISYDAIAKMAASVPTASSD